MSSEFEIAQGAQRRGQFQQPLKTQVPELAWSIKNSLYGIKSTEKNDLRTRYFRALKRKPVRC